jgi:hypothetical protein
MIEALAERSTTDRIRPLVSLIRARFRSWVKDLHVEVVGEQVILFGRAYSYYGKQMVQEELIRRCRPAVLTNQIEVEG